MQNKKLMAMPILLISILLITGFAYACWLEPLYINGTVETGTLCAKFVEPIGRIDDGNDWTCDVGFIDIHRTNKDIGSSSAEILDDKTIEVTLTNVYSCYLETISFHIENCGTIPWKIINVTITSDCDEIVFTATGPILQEIDLDGDGLYDIEIKWLDWTPQVHDETEVSFKIHVLQDAPEGATNLAFTAKIFIANWNCDE